MSTAITFEEISTNTERTAAFASLVKTAKGRIELAWAVYPLVGQLDLLVRTLDQSLIDRLNPTQELELSEQLQKIHTLLRQLQKSPSVRRIESYPVMNGLLERMRGDAEKLSDLIDVLVMRTDQDFKNLVSGCAASLGL